MQTPKPVFTDAVCLAYDSHLADAFEQLSTFAQYFDTPEAVKASKDWRDVARLAGKATYDFDATIWNAAGWTEKQAISLLNKATRQAQAEVIESSFASLLALRRLADTERRAFAKCRTPALREKKRL